MRLGTSQSVSLDLYGGEANTTDEGIEYVVNATDMLKTGQGIKEGGKITSLNGEYVLAMKGGLDEGGNIGGTIEFYKNTAVDKDKDPPIKTILGTLIPDQVKTSGHFSNFFHGPYSLIMQRDGNVVYYYNHPI